MSGWLRGILVLAFGSALAAGCNNPSCGKGTKQTQDSSGNIVCVPVDAVGAEPCKDDPDAGTSIIGGICVGNTICGPGTIRVPRNDGSGTFYCQGVGGMATCADQTIQAGNICIEGTIRDFNTFMPIAAGQKVHIAVYNPLDFLMMGSAATPLPGDGDNNTASKDINGPSFIFKQVQLPSLGLIALAVTDAGGTPSVFALSGTGLQGTVLQSYKLDGYTVPVTNVQQWTTMGGIDYDGMGAYVGFFFSDTSRAPAPMNDFSHYETTPVAGVKIVQVINGMPQQVANARYFGPTRDQIDMNLTATGPLGGAIVPIKVLSAFSGQGGGVTKWEGKPGGSAAHVVFVDRFHPGM